MSRLITIINSSNPELAPIYVKYCDDFFGRLQGFTFRKNIGANEGLVLAEKKDSKLDTSIHMLFVWTDLAVFWVNSSMTVVDKVLAKSWRPYYASKLPARFVLELSPNKLEAFQIGDKLEFRND